MLPVAPSSPADARIWDLRGVIRGKPVQHHRQRQGRAVSARSCQPAVPCAGAQQAVGVGLHPRLREGRLYVATWAGFVYVAFVIDVYARYIVGLAGQQDQRMPASCWMHWSRRYPRAAPRPRAAAWFYHSRSRAASIYRSSTPSALSEAGIEPSVGSVGDSYDNALAETINGLYKAEVIHRRGPWRILRGR